MLNWIWLGLILISVVYASLFGDLNAVTGALFDTAKSAITLVIGLVGAMMFMLGIMRVAFDGGLRRFIARMLAPLLRRLFPDVPPDHPAMGAMVMNMASNVLGLGNAATPFGLKAMVELDKLNPQPGSASNAMVLFLAINTSAITLMLPTGTIAMRAAAGSAEPEAIWIPTLIATTCSTLAAVGAYFLLGRLPMFRQRPVAGVEALATDAADGTAAEEESPISTQPTGIARWLVIAGTCGVLLFALGRNVLELLQSESLGGVLREVAQTWAFPLLLVALLLVGVARRVPVYESAIAGAREGLDVAIKIAPYLVAILVAVGMFRASGALDDWVIPMIRPLTDLLAVPPEALPMALLRPLSGSGAFGVMGEILTAHGADSFAGQLASTLQGSTETTFYVLALYFGAARIRQGRHALAACLTGDVAGFLGAVAACHWFFG